MTAACLGTWASHGHVKVREIGLLQLLSSTTARWQKSHGRVSSAQWTPNLWCTGWCWASDTLRSIIYDPHVFQKIQGTHSLSLYMIGDAIQRSVIRTCIPPVTQGYIRYDLRISWVGFIVVVGCSVDLVSLLSNPMLSPLHQRCIAQTECTPFLEQKVI